jgi:signal transduction histidine kinase
VRATAILRDVSAADALEQLREGFVATVSHELRTPIALIRGYAATLLEFELEP